MWRLRKQIKGREVATPLELKVSIMYEIGTDPRTYRIHRDALLNLTWLEQEGEDFRLTDRDLTHS